MVSNIMASTKLASCVNLVVLLCLQVEGMTVEEKIELRDQTLSMFYHAYNAYMTHAFPADELMPLSCRGRYRGSEPSRGNDDDTLGNFTLTLIDSLDTLAILDEGEFEVAVDRVVNQVKFDTDVTVSVFETNIRVLGGLLGGHAMALNLRNKNKMLWYNNQLLKMADDLGQRLLPAFNSSTGIPFSRINLREGIDKVNRETCTACAGTMILEFAALSRFTGNPVYEIKARHAMEQLWNFRHRESELVGTVINVENGEWQRRDSGVGAGIDSYYEYLFKGYILLADDNYLARFNRHYKSIRKYIQKGPMWVDVHMHKPTSNAKNFMDALMAYWPGLQVLTGDLESAIETHEMLYQVMRRHGGFLPEAFTTDFRVHWGQSPLRPEFIESTYFLYKATKDPHYLEVGRQVLNSIEQLARVPCGYAGIKDVRTGAHEDRMDSFVLAELFKYLFLLFSDEEDLNIDIDDYVFTTEAHLIPLSISAFSPTASSSESSTSPPPIVPLTPADEEVEEMAKTCIAHPELTMRFPGMTEEIRKPLHNMVEMACPKSAQNDVAKLRASEFQAGNKDHIAALEQMGIRLVTMKDGRVQLLHTATQAASADDARDGMIFMQEMIELSKSASSQEAEPQTRVVEFFDQNDELVSLVAGPAQFGYDLATNAPVEGKAVKLNPIHGCRDITNGDQIAGKIAILERGECMFILKARNLERLGAIGGIVVDNNLDSSAVSSPLFSMSGDGTDDVRIPLVFLFDLEGRRVLDAISIDPSLLVTLAEKPGYATTPTPSEEALRSSRPAEDESTPRREFLDVYQILDDSKEIVHVGSDDFKLVVRINELSSMEEATPPWDFHPSMRLVRSSPEEQPTFYLYLDSDVPASKDGGPTVDPPMKDIRDALFKALAQSTNFESLDNARESIDLLTYIATRSLQRNTGKASRMHLTSAQKRLFDEFSRRLRPSSEAIVEEADVVEVAAPSDGATKSCRDSSVPPTPSSRWSNLKAQGKKDAELAGLLEEVESFLKDPKLAKYVTVADSRSAVEKNERTSVDDETSIAAPTSPRPACSGKWRGRVGDVPDSHSNGVVSSEDGDVNELRKYVDADAAASDGERGDEDPSVCPKGGRVDVDASRGDAASIDVPDEL